MFAGDLACYVRGLCAPVGRCGLSQHSNNNSAYRYTVVLARGASAWEYPQQLLSITTHTLRIFDTPTKHKGFLLRYQRSRFNFTSNPQFLLHLHSQTKTYNAKANFRNALYLVNVMPIFHVGVMSENYLVIFP